MTKSVKTFVKCEAQFVFRFKLLYYIHFYRNLVFPYRYLFPRRTSLTRAKLKHIHTYIHTHAYPRIDIYGELVNSASSIVRRLAFQTRNPCSRPSNRGKVEKSSSNLQQNYQESQSSEVLGFLDEIVKELSSRLEHFPIYYLLDHFT